MEGDLGVFIFVIILSVTLHSQLNHYEDRRRDRFRTQEIQHEDYQQEESSLKADVENEAYWESAHSNSSDVGYLLCT